MSTSTTQSIQTDKKREARDEKHLKILSYYQSTLRNAGMFTTLSLAALAAAHGSKSQKKSMGSSCSIYRSTHVSNISNICFNTTYYFKRQV